MFHRGRPGLVLPAVSMAVEGLHGSVFESAFEHVAAALRRARGCFAELDDVEQSSGHPGGAS